MSLEPSVELTQELGMPLVLYLTRLPIQCLQDLGPPPLPSPCSAGQCPRQGLGEVGGGGLLLRGVHIPALAKPLELSWSKVGWGGCGCGCGRGREPQGRRVTVARGALAIGELGLPRGERRLLGLQGRTRRPCSLDPVRRVNRCHDQSSQRKMDGWWWWWWWWWGTRWQSPLESGI